MTRREDPKLFISSLLLFVAVKSKSSGYYKLFAEKWCKRQPALRQPFRFHGESSSCARLAESHARVGSFFSPRHLETVGATRPPLPTFLWQVWTRARAMDDSGIIRRRRLQVRAQPFNPVNTPFFLFTFKNKCRWWSISHCYQCQNKCKRRFRIIFVITCEEISHIGGQWVRLSMWRLHLEECAFSITSVEHTKSDITGRTRWHG